MMAPAAEALGVAFHVLSEAEGSSAAQVSSQVTVGDYKDFDTLRAFAETVDVITFDHEHVPTEHLEALVAAGHSVHPGPHALVYAQDKLKMRAKMDELGLPNPTWREVTDTDSLQAFGDEIGWPIIVKTPRGGYDGHGCLLYTSDAADDTR